MNRRAAALGAALLLTACGGRTEAPRESAPQTAGRWEWSAAFSLQLRAEKPGLPSREKRVRPQATAQAQAYYVEYLEPYGLPRLWRENFDQDYVPQNRGLMNYLYFALSPPATKEVEQPTPIGTVEAVIQGTFPASSEEIQASFGADYRPEEGIYLLRYGFGGVSPIGVITRYEEEGGRLTLWADWYWWDSYDRNYTHLAWRSKTILEQREDGGVRYLSNEARILDPDLEW